MKTLKQRHAELLNHLDIPPALKSIIYEGVVRNEKDWLTEKRKDTSEKQILTTCWKIAIDELMGELTR